MSGTTYAEAGPLIETLKRVAAALKKAKIPFALGGGYAVYARGGHESLHDVDFMLLQEDVEEALSALTDAGLRPVRPPEDWLVKAYDDDRLVDLIFRPVNRPVTREQLARAEELGVGSVQMPVLSATDLVVYKLLSFDEHNCDFATALPVVRALREQVDWPSVRADVAASPFAQAFLVLAEQLDLVPREATPSREQVA